MPTFKSILFPVDFSERCALTASFAAQLASKFQSEIHLLHVIEEMPILYASPDVPVKTIETYQRAVEENARLALGRFGNDAFVDLTVTRSVLSGEPAAVITKYAADHHIEVILMPTHGRGIFRRLLLGSVTSKVLHDSNCAVLTMAHTETLHTPVELKLLLCAVDLGAEDEYVIAEAAELAKACGAELRLVYALPRLQPVPEFPIDPELEGELEEQARKRIDEMQKRCGIQVEAIVKTGDVVEVIQDAATEFKASLVVIGRGKLHHISSIIKQSPCPVLSIPDPS